MGISGLIYFFLIFTVVAALIVFGAE